MVRFCFFFIFWLGAVTVIHFAMQSAHGIDTRNEACMRRNIDQDDDMSSLCGLVLFFFASIAGVCMWIFLGVRWVHPVQNCLVQLLGVALLLVCGLGFESVHVSMGKNWSPEPEAKTEHALVTSGLFRWARHPMYAVCLWAAVASALATLNWVITLYPIGIFWVVWLRIPTEERILVDLFGDDYCEYRSRVPALGVPWGCLDRCLPTINTREFGRPLLAGGNA